MRHERITLFLSLVTEALAGTAARRLDGDRVPALDHDAFVRNLVDMCVGALLAPASPLGHGAGFAVGHGAGFAARHGAGTAVASGS